MKGLIVHKQRDWAASHVIGEDTSGTLVVQVVYDVPPWKYFRIIEAGRTIYEDKHVWLSADDCSRAGLLKASRLSGARTDQSK